MGVKGRDGLLGGEHSIDCLFFLSQIQVLSERQSPVPVADHFGLVELSAQVPAARRLRLGVGEIETGTEPGVLGFFAYPQLSAMIRLLPSVSIIKE